MEKKTRQEIEEQVSAIIAEEFRCNYADVKPNALLCEDLRADSLDRYDMALHLELNFGITISDSLFAKTSSFCVKDVCDMVEQLLEEKEKNQ